MKKQKTPKNPYATSRGGKIDAPKTPAGKNEPRGKKETGNDLRVGR